VLVPFDFLSLPSSSIPFPPHSSVLQSCISTYLIYLFTYLITLTSDADPGGRFSQSVCITGRQHDEEKSHQAATNDSIHRAVVFCGECKVESFSATHADLVLSKHGRFISLGQAVDV
jgi:hypothetical protein